MEGAIDIAANIQSGRMPGATDPRSLADKVTAGSVAFGEKNRCGEFWHLSLLLYLHKSNDIDKCMQRQLSDYSPTAAKEISFNSSAAFIQFHNTDLLHIFSR